MSRFPFDLPAQLLWWVGGIALAVLVLMALLEARDAFRAWWWRRRSPHGRDGGGFRVSEEGRLRRRHLRRFRPGYRSLRSRGLGEPPIETAGEWSPTHGAGKPADGSHEPEERPED